MNSSSDKIKSIFIALMSSVILVSVGCDDGDPRRENVPELITTAQLTFTPQGGGSTIVVTATDPDGEGVQDIEVDGPINLSANATYTLSIGLFNELADPSSPEYDISDEVGEEADEHMFFFEWTDGLFDNPAGNGNVDNRADDVDYSDQDDAGLPLGLVTEWETGAAATGDFRVILKHQPDLKSASSMASEGETDMDITFDLIIQ